MNQHLRILHLEDNEHDARLARAALVQAGLNPDMATVTSLESFEHALDRGDFDVILSDHCLPGVDGATALRLASQKQPAVPFIFLSGRTPNRSEQANFVSKSDLGSLARTIRNAVAIAASSGEPNRPSAWYVRAMERLVGVVQDLSLARDLPRIVEIVRTAARELTGADGASFVLREGDCCYYADEDAISPLWKGQRFPVAACVSGWVMTHAESAVIEDIYSDSRVPVDAYRPTFVKSLVLVPIRKASPVGAIGNYWAMPHVARPEEVKILQALADCTSVAMENVQLYTGLERKVAERTARLEALNEELEAYSSSVSHDLRAPLRHITGFIETLKAEVGEALSPEGLRYMTIISRSARRMSTLVEDLLSFSRMSQKELRQDRLDMNQMVTEVVAELEPDAAGRVISWSIDDLPQVEADPTMIRQVWTNLIANSIKYTRHRPDTVVRIGARRREDEIEFFVQDNGAGFEPHLAKRLFTPFQRLHRAEEFEGNGIGLAAVSRMVQRHGGRTWAEGKVNGGATFFFTLPLA